MERYQRKNTMQYSAKLQKEWHRFRDFVMGNLKIRLILILCGILLIAGVTKLITDQIFYKEAGIADAFAVTKSGCIESRLQITADYGTGFLTEHDKQALAAYLANALGIRMEGAAEYKEDETSQIYTYEKEARQAATTIKIVTLQEDVARTYLYTELVIYDDVDHDILKYRDIIIEALDELKVVQVETTLQFLGAYDGLLAMSEWDRIVDSMIHELNGRIVYENRDMELYTVYGYSALLPEYISVNQKKINIQAAMRYEADYDRTVVYLATPMIRGDW